MKHITQTTVIRTFSQSSEIVQKSVPQVKSVLWDPHQDGHLVVADAEAVHVFQGASGSGSKPNRHLTLHVGPDSTLLSLEMDRGVL